MPANASSAINPPALDNRLPGLRRWFVGPFFAANGLAAAAAVRHARSGRGGSRAAWLAAAATHGAVIAHAPRGWPRPQSGPASMLGAAIIGTAATASLPRSTWPAAVAGLLAAGGAATYVGWYASFGRTPSPALEVGRPLPELKLTLHDGRTLTTAELHGAPTAIFFTRGNWCPFCTAQIQQLAADYRCLAREGVRVIVVSSQPEHESRRLAAQFGVEILWATDPELRTARALGILDPNGVPIGIPTAYGRDTIMPTLVVTDAAGTVIGSEQTDNFRIRPDARTVLDILHHAGLISPTSVTDPNERVEVPA